MSVRITSDEQVVALFDSVEGRAFGPVFSDGEEAEEFLRWLQEKTTTDPRQIEWADMKEYYSDFQAETGRY